MKIEDRIEALEIKIAQMEANQVMDAMDLDWAFEEICKLKDPEEIATPGYNWLGYPEWDEEETEVELGELVEFTNCDIYKDCAECPEFDFCSDATILEDDLVCPADCDEDCECCGCEEEECDECEVYLRDQERQCSPECEEDCTTCYWEEGAAYDEMEAYMDALRSKGL